VFLHPWAVAVGMAAVALPFVVHWLTKPRPVRMPLSTLRFVREVIRQRRARHRLRDGIVLALRTLAVLLVALAIARPRFGAQPLISHSQTDAAVRIVVLDVSQSMAALSRGVESLERGRSTAANYLRYRPGLRANLILAGAASQATFDEPSQNFEALRDELSAARVRPERLDIHRALTLAAEMLTPESVEDRRRRELVIVSDFQRTNWARADFSPLPQDVQIQLESTETGEAPSNFALLGASVSGRVAEGTGSQLAVEIGNFSAAARTVTADVALGNAMFRLEGLCPAGRRTTLVQEIALRQTGWQLGQARLVGIDDALAADNSCGIAVAVTGKPQFVVLTRQPAEQRPSSSYYLQRALVPDSILGERSSAKVTRMDSAEIDRMQLISADLIVIDHPGKLAPDDVNLLAGLLRRGRAVLYVAAESMDATTLRLLGESLGGSLQLPVEFTPPPATQARRNLFLASYRDDSPPFNVFGENTSAIVGRLRFGGGLLSTRRQEALEDDLLASYADGTACLVATSTDAGALAVLNADLSLSNLSTSEAFVPLLDQLVQRLLQRRSLIPAAWGGEPLVARLPSEAGPARDLLVVGPEMVPSSPTAMSVEGELIDEGAGAVWRWPSPDRLGVYRVLRGDELVFAMPVRLSPDESPLERLAPDVVQDRLAGSFAVQYHAVAATPEERDHLWTWLLTACVLCVIAEISALVFFRN
jgi:hypothetical protein